MSLSGVSHQGSVVREMGVVTRFAPSPTGYLHLGHALAARTAWQRARAAGGRFLLRLADIDPGRCRPEYADAILEDLRWLGLEWDGPVLRQSDRLPLYQACLHSLAARHLIYPCFCSRAEIARELAASAHAPHGPDGPLYPGTCRRLTEDARAARLQRGDPHCWRLDSVTACAHATTLRFTEEGAGEIAATPALFGDVVLARRDAPASYHLCVCYDDAAQGITLVTRATDLRPATHLHRLLQHLCGWDAPCYAFHPLIRDAEGRKLSKRDAALTLRALRAQGIKPAEIFKRLETTPEAI